MKGLKINVTNSDLVVKQEDKLFCLFVMFKDKKYGTKYIVFSDEEKKQLYYGSPLINENKMVIMKFKSQRDEELVKQFVWNFLTNDDMSFFDIIEIPLVNKLEIIDNNILDVKEEYINKLYDIFFKQEELDNIEFKKEEKKNKKGYLLFVIFMFILLGIGALYLMNNSQLIYGKNIYAQCTKRYKINDLNVDSNEVISFTFNNSQKLKVHEKEINYLFKEQDVYYEFKEKKLNNKYISESGEDLFDDDKLLYKKYIKYNLNTDYNLPTDYDEIFEYYSNDDYDCNNVEK